MEIKDNGLIIFEGEYICPEVKKGQDVGTWDGLFIDECEDKDIGEIRTLRYLVEDECSISDIIECFSYNPDEICFEHIKQVFAFLDENREEFGFKTSISFLVRQKNSEIKPVIFIIQPLLDGICGDKCRYEQRLGKGANFIIPKV